MLLVVGIASEDPNSRRLLVKQCYPLKTGGEQSCESARKKAMEETSRIITSDGTVIRTLVDGSTQVSASLVYSQIPLVQFVVDLLFNSTTNLPQVLTHTHTHTHNRFMAVWILSGTTRESRYQKKHSPTHTNRGRQSSLICFIHLL